MQRVIKLNHQSALVSTYHSSENYNDYMNESMGFLDTVYTICFRWPGVVKTLSAGTFSLGTPIESVAGTPLAPLMTLILAGVALNQGYAIYAQDFEKRKKQEQAYRTSYSKILNNFKPASTSALAQPVPLSSVNKELEEQLVTDESLKAKYTAITVDQAGRWTFALKEPQAQETKSRREWAFSKLTTFIYGSWVSLSLASYAYWILWIGALVITGQVLPIGIGGLGAAGFALPLTVGALYPLLKLRNWWNHHRGSAKVAPDTVALEELNPHLQLEAQKEAALLAQTVNLALQKKALLESLEKDLNIKNPNPEVQALQSSPGLKNDAVFLALGQNKWRKVGLTFLTTTIGTYVGTQFGAWLAGDFIQAITGTVLSSASLISGLGVAFLVSSVAYGAYGAYQRHQEIKKYQQALKEKVKQSTQNEKTLEAIYEEQNNKLATLKEEIKQKDPAWFSKNESLFENLFVLAKKEAAVEAPITWKMRAKALGSNVYRFLGGGMTGAMIARIAIVAGTVTFIPFVAATLSNPVTLTILALCGVVYGSVKLYQAKQAEKEAALVSEWKQRDERVKLLQEQVSNDALKLTLLKAKEKTLKEEASAAASSSSLQKTSTVRARFGGIFTQVFNVVSSPVEIDQLGCSIS